jgi:hypothetical protein
VAELADAGDLKSSGGDTPCGFDHFGIHRMVRDVFQISGKVLLPQRGQLKTLMLNNAHTLAPTFLEALQSVLAFNGVRLILRQI